MKRFLFQLWTVLGIAIFAVSYTLVYQYTPRISNVSMQESMGKHHIIFSFNQNILNTSVHISPEIMHTVSLRGTDIHIRTDTPLIPKTSYTFTFSIPFKDGVFQENYTYTVPESRWYFISNDITSQGCLMEYLPDLNEAKCITPKNVHVFQFWKKNEEILILAGNNITDEQRENPLFADITQKTLYRKTQTTWKTVVSPSQYRIHDIEILRPKEYIIDMGALNRFGQESKRGLFFVSLGRLQTRTEYIQEHFDYISDMHLSPDGQVLLYHTPEGYSLLFINTKTNEFIGSYDRSFGFNSSGTSLWFLQNVSEQSRNFIVTLHADGRKESFGKENERITLYTEHGNDVLYVKNQHNNDTFPLFDLYENNEKIVSHPEYSVESYSVDGKYIALNMLFTPEKHSLSPDLFFHNETEIFLYNRETKKLYSTKKYGKNIQK